MSGKFQNKYRIPSARYPFHDYDGGAYFVTICTAGMGQFFGEISDGKINLTKIGRFASEQIENVTRHYPYAEIPLYVVMPNHVHLIVFIDGNTNHVRRDAIHRVSVPEKTQTAENSDVINLDAINRVSTAGVGGITGNKNPMLHNNLPRIIRWFKGSVTHFAKQINPDFSWQTRYHDRIIRDHNEMNRIAEYIENNIINWELDEYNV